ncbi:hypothetical protein A3A64_04660 [Candidatus Gottesmanbacteria bacterium RIFCSPLOWO2_01_FULL_48_11]|uniref:Uncharacterized protein n=1 Tax=Candidatus Gottesmanbacteria bacterium RIFCSPLOWO2_01_FULL_48_11 TaxID=1798395 RepID=A0A1F6AT05_9BACT|nr:MAG: hypothetical protein A3A64_04660 [Candidatus Gottesmanbacteria bacterium RIFCSPLOWO2_01_FULL_48_11]
MKLLAQAVLEETKLGTLGGEGLGPFGKSGLFSGEGGGGIALAKVTGTISSIVGIMTVAAAIWCLIHFLLGGFLWITAGGDKSSLEKARHKMTDAFIGFIIVVSAWIILALMGQFFGYDILVGDPGAPIEELKFQ